MPISYRVIDLRTSSVASGETIVEAGSPEDAARQALGLDLVRSGRRSDIKARVYFQSSGAQPISMVRLYGKAEDRAEQE